MVDYIILTTLQYITSLSPDLTISSHFLRKILCLCAAPIFVVVCCYCCCCLCSCYCYCSHLCSFSVFPVRYFCRFLFLCFLCFFSVFCFLRVVLVLVLILVLVLVLLLKTFQGRGLHTRRGLLFLAKCMSEKMFSFGFRCRFYAFFVVKTVALCRLCFNIAK